VGVAVEDDGDRRDLAAGDALGLCVDYVGVEEGWRLAAETTASILRTLATWPTLHQGLSRGDRPIS
jgi:hypothetical protein